MNKSIHIDSVEVLPPEKPQISPSGRNLENGPKNQKCHGMALLQNIASQLEVEIENFRELQHEAAIRAVRIGLLLLQAKSELKHGEFLPWLEENIKNFSQSYAYRFMKLAEIFMGEYGIALLPAVKQISGNDNGSFTGTYGRQVLAFIGEKSLNDLFDEYGIKSRPRPRLGGDNILVAWLRENGYADLVGTRRAKLPENVRAEFAAWINEQHRPLIEEGRMAEIRLQHDELERLLSELITRKKYAFLPQERIRLLYELLTAARQEIAAALGIKKGRP